LREYDNLIKTKLILNKKSSDLKKRKEKEKEKKRKEKKEKCFFF
jgi:hypothetical protein